MALVRPDPLGMLMDLVAKFVGEKVRLHLLLVLEPELDLFVAADLDAVVSANGARLGVLVVGLAPLNAAGGLQFVKRKKIKYKI